MVYDNSYGPYLIVIWTKKFKKKKKKSRSAQRIDVGRGGHRGWGGKACRQVGEILSLGSRHTARVRR